MSKVLNMKKSFDLIMITFPDHISYETPALERQHGLTAKPQIQLTDLTDDEIIQYATWMRSEFIKHCRDLKERSVKD